MKKSKPAGAAIAARETLRERRKTEGAWRTQQRLARSCTSRGVTRGGRGREREAGERGRGPAGVSSAGALQAGEAAARRAAGGGGEVGAMHRAHSAVGVKMDKAKRPEFRGKNT